jgi:hypothetical protein
MKQAASFAGFWMTLDGKKKKFLTYVEKSVDLTGLLTLSLKTISRQL